MDAYFFTLGGIGLLMALMFSGVFVYEMSERGSTPRKMILSVVGFLLAGILAGVLLPLIILAGIIYMIVSFIKNDWGWHKAHLPGRFRNAAH